MAINVEVTKNDTENNLAVLRRFTKKVQGSGVLPRLRSKRYSSRNISEYVKKKKALKRIGRQTEIALALKMGKILPGKK